MMAKDSDGKDGEKRVKAKEKSQKERKTGGGAKARNDAKGEIKCAELP